MKNKKLLTSLACGAFALVGGLTLVGCGGPKTETLDQKAFTDYVAEHKLNYKDGYQAKIVEEGSIVEVKSKKTANVVEGFLKVSDAEGTLQMAKYLKGGKVYTQVGSEKYYLALDNEGDDSLQYLYLAYEEEGALAMLDSVLVDKTENANAEDIATFKKTTDDKKVTWEITPKDNQNNQVPTFNIEYNDGQLEKLVVGTLGTFEPLDGAIAFPSDLDQYRDANPALTLVSEDYVQQMSDIRDYMTTTLYNTMKTSEEFEAGHSYSYEAISEKISEFNYYVKLATIANIDSEEVNSVTIGNVEFSKDQKVTVSLGGSRFLTDKAWYVEEGNLMVAAPVALAEFGLNQTLKVNNSLTATVNIAPFESAVDVTGVTGGVNGGNTVGEKDQNGVWTFNVTDTTTMFKFDIGASSAQNVLTRSVRTYANGSVEMSYGVTDLEKDFKLGLYPYPYGEDVESVRNSFDGMKADYSIIIGNKVYKASFVLDFVEAE